MSQRRNIINTDGDQAKVVSLLEESLAIPSELGMKPLMQRVLSQREILKAQSLGRTPLAKLG